MSTPEIDIIIIKGAPATGKSQTAKELATYFPTGVRMEVDNLRSMVISVDWTNQDEHKSILEISTGLVADFLSAGFKPVIVVDTFSGDKLNSYYGKLREINQEWKIALFGLYTDEDVLKSRLEMRAENKFKDYLIAAKLNGDTKKYKHNEEFQIDTSSLQSAETAKIIYERL